MMGWTQVKENKVQFQLNIFICKIALSGIQTWDLQNQLCLNIVDA